MVHSINSIHTGGNSPIKPAYPENLSEIADSADTRSKSYGKYSGQQMLEASKKLNAREYAAYGHLSNDATSAGIAKYAQAYVKYINQLSPEEQNGVRYKGTKESVSGLLAQAQAAAAAESASPAKKADKPSSLLLQLLTEMERNQQKSGSRGLPNQNADRVTISEDARRLASLT
jgi:hypothetical protein